LGTIGWHWVFLINVPIGVIGLLFITRFCRICAAQIQTSALNLAGAL